MPVRVYTPPTDLYDIHIRTNEDRDVLKSLIGQALVVRSRDYHLETDRFYSVRNEILQVVRSPETMLRRIDHEDELLEILGDLYQNMKLQEENVRQAYMTYKETLRTCLLRGERDVIEIMEERKFRGRTCHVDQHRRQLTRVNELSIRLEESIMEFTADMTRRLVRRRRTLFVLDDE